MPDLRALRRRWEAQIQELQEKLRALDMIEKAAAGSDKSQVRPRSRGGTVIEDIRKTLLKDPDRIWNVKDAYEAVKNNGAPHANHDNVSTAFRRLLLEGFLERAGGNKRVGFGYRLVKNRT